MTEEKVKRRGWVKNAAIVFLSVMLVLTFFSNTIMNRSLPEVAAQYAQSGSITTRIRGTGTVTANEYYEITLDQSREVESVAVKVGDTVEAGDVLFYLADKDSDELKQAETALEELQYQYQEAVLNASESDYAKENRDIRLAREALEAAIADRDAKKVGEEALRAARDAVEANKAEVKSRKSRVAALQTKVDEAQAALDALGGRNEGSYGGSALYNAMLDAKAALDDAEAALEVAKLRFQAAYDVLVLIADYFRVQDGKPASAQPIYTAAKAADYAAAEKADAENNWNLPSVKEVDEADANIVTVKDNEDEEYRYNKADLYEAYTAIRSAQEAVENCGRAYDQAADAYYGSFDGGNAYQYDQLNKKLKEAQAELRTAQNELTQAQERQAEAEAALQELETAMEEYKAAVAAAKAAQTALEDLLFALEEQQKADDKSLALQSLQISKLKARMEDAQAEVDRLRAGSVDAAVVSKVRGIVKSIGVSAGRTAEPGTPLATILVPERGYSVSITVTAEQAKKVTVGDEAEVVTGWWYSGDITARLSSIRPDPNAPNTSRILNFDIRGEVEDGTQISLSIGQKSQNYDIIVPNSAVRSDTNGDFVLIVVAKNSPLGNRYVATRVDVQVLAKDDLNTAVSGGVANGDFVITTSTRPLESGMLVRLAEG